MAQEQSLVEALARLQTIAEEQEQLNSQRAALYEEAVALVETVKDHLAQIGLKVQPDKQFLKR